jgi:hypothetical protein
MRTALIAFIMFFASACSPSNLIEKGLTPQERSVIRGAIDDISRRDNASLAKKMQPELATRAAPVLGQMQQALPTPPLEISLTKANWTVLRGTRNLDAVYQVHGKSGWALVEATTQSSQGRTLLTGIYVQPTATNPRQLNGFSLARAGAAQWAMLAAMLTALVVTIAALVRIWRSGLFRKRWLWTIGAIIGVMTLKLNWSTGQFYFQPVSLQLFSVSATKQPVYAPWMLGVSFPLFALIALLRRRREPVEDAYVVS